MLCPALGTDDSNGRSRWLVAAVILCSGTQVYGWPLSRLVAGANRRLKDLMAAHPELGGTAKRKGLTNTALQSTGAAETQVNHMRGPAHVGDGVL